MTSNRRPALVGGLLSLLLVIGGALFFLFDAGAPELPPESLSVPGGVPPATVVDDAARETPTGGDSTTADGGDPSAPAAEELDPPLLSGRVTGEGQGIPNATVHLFATEQITVSLLRLEKLLPGEGQIPDISRIIRTVRGEIQRFKDQEIVATTGPDGTYRFRRPAPGGYFVLAMSDDWLFKFGDVVSIRTDEPRRLDIELERGEQLEGQVVHTLGHALPGVTVTADYRPGGLPGIGRVIRRGLQYVNGEFLRGPFQRTSGPDGTFSFSGLPAGLYDITAEHPNGVRATVSGVDTSTDRAVVYLGEGAIVRGYLVDGVGVPVEGVEVVLEAQEDRIQLPLPLVTFTDLANSVYAALGDGPRRAVSGSDGAFRVAGLSPGRYLFSVESAGFLPLKRSLSVDWGSVEDMGPVQLSRGEAITGVVQSLAGESLEGARVIAVPATLGFVNMGQAMNDFLGDRVAARTDASGSFRLEGLVRTEYRVTAGATGYAALQQKSSAPSEEPLLFSLEPGYRVAGRVLSAIDGAPLPGARVRCRGVSTDTSEDGRFELSGIVPSGRSADPFSDGPFGRRRSADGGQGDLAAGPPLVDIRASMNGYMPSGFEVNLDERPDDLTIELRGAPRIRGRVTTPDGSPAPGTVLRLTPPIPVEAEGMMSRFGIQRGLIFFGLTAADVDGNFTFNRYFVPDERSEIQVLASHPAYANSVSETIRLEEGGQDVLDVEVQLARGAVVTGMVTDGSAPVEGATVRLRRALPETRDLEEFSVFTRMVGLPKGGDTVPTNSEGRFEFTQLLPGAFSISAEMPHFTDSPEQPVTVEAGDTVEVELVMDPGGVILGKVIDDFGAEVAGALVRLVRRPTEDTERDRRRYLFERTFGGAYKKTRSDDEGYFRLTGLPDGSYSLIVERDGYARAEISELEPDSSRVSVRLVPSAILSGRVADAATGEPLVNFQVHLEPVGQPVAESERDEFRIPRTRGYQDSEGRFRRTDLAPGTYECRVAATGFVPVERKLQLVARESREAEFLLTQAGRIRGVVLDTASGQPLVGAVVHVTDPVGVRAASTPRKETPEEAQEEDRRAVREFWGERTRGKGAETDSDGAYLLQSLPREARALVAECEGYIPEVVEGFEIGVGQEIAIDFALRPGFSISGTVVDASGDPAPKRFVFLRGVSKDNRHVRKFHTADPSGGFRIGGLPKGVYRVYSPGRGDRLEAPAVVVVVEGNARDVRLQLQESTAHGAR